MPKNKIGEITISIMIFIIVIFFIIYIKQINQKYNNHIQKLNTEITKITKENNIYKNNISIIKNNKNKIKNNLLNALYYFNKNVDPMIANQIIDALIIDCKKVNLPPLLSLCIIKQESNFNPLSNNNLNAIGLMQIIPKYHQDKIKKHGWKPHELFFIKNNILLGTEILKEYFINSKNNMVKALQKYVGASVKSNAKKYIENIINDYVSLNVILFMNNRIKKREL